MLSRWFRHSLLGRILPDNLGSQVILPIYRREPSGKLFLSSKHHHKNIFFPFRVLVLEVLHKLAFFFAHAVHARGSDGHQNVLWSISYSHVVREQVKSKKVSSKVETKQTPNTKTNQTNTTKEDTQKTK